MNTNNIDAEDWLSSMKSQINRNLTDIENRDDLSADEKAERVIHIIAGACAGVAVQPIPFADIFLLTPIQMYLAERLAAVRGIPLSESSIKEIVLELAKVVGLGMLAQQAALGLYKIGLPGLAGFTTIPLVYGLTYAIGRVLDYMIQERAKGRKLNSQTIKQAWESAKTEGKRKGKGYRQADMEK
ncbi:DUF697 domain-containing protein [Magnetovirga frankeli]|uniref:YcjF family protein n=1 Tax=Magnetovirga frankeli TaxID=947516 RepID=UPI0012936242|nr:DUF697 domain-containing protein [gamma proteobacterium SS-5]